MINFSDNLYIIIQYYRQLFNKINTLSFKYVIIKLLKYKNRTDYIS